MNKEDRIFLNGLRKVNVKLLEEIDKEQSLQRLSRKIQEEALAFNALSGRKLALVSFISQKYLKVLRMHVKLLKRLDQYFQFEVSVASKFTKEGFDDRDFKTHKMFERLNRGYLRECLMEVNWKITEFFS